MSESAAYTRRSWSNAKPTTLASPVDGSVTTINVVDGSSYPDGSAGPFDITLDRGLSTEERVEVTARSGNSFTGCARGADGTTGQAHSLTVNGVELTSTKRDYDEANRLVAQANGWADWTPTIAPAEGSMTIARTPANAHARWCQIGKTVFVSFAEVLGFSAIASCFGITITLPVAARDTIRGAGGGGQLLNAAAQVLIGDDNTKITVRAYNTALLLAQADWVEVSIFYEVA